MIVDIGFGVLVITFLVAIYAVGAALYGGLQSKPRWTESARISMQLTFPLITISVACLLYLLVTGNYSVSYVYTVVSNQMPTYLKMTALWGGQSGSLLFWCWSMSAFATAVTFRKWDRDREFLPWVVVVTMTTLLFFLAMVIFQENPFVRYWADASGKTIQAFFQPAGTDLIMPPDGNGLNPLLRHPGMIIHPPMLYLGFVSFVIPFAFAVAALITGRTDDRWIRLTRRWTLVAWLFLSCGLVLGMRWAYDVLGWGGYWAWDPVEIAALMPWLTGTALLHSVMIQEKRGMFKRWNMVLTVLTYDLVIYGTFLTRSGVLSSVHAFAESSIGPLFFGFIAITLIASVSLLIYRWNDLKSEASLKSFLSRESLFLLNNLLFMGILFICFWGVNFPLISELVTGQKVTVGPGFYNSATGPLWAALLLLMGVAPLSAWITTTPATMGKAIWKALAASLIIPIVLLATGMRSFGAILGFWLIALVVCVTGNEYIREVRARQHSTGENFISAFLHLTIKNRRRYGGYIIHLGVVLMGLGVIGINMFQTQTQATLAPGQSIQLSGYSFTYKSLTVFDTDEGRNIARAVMDVSQNGKQLAELYPRRDYYYDSQQPMTIPGLRSTFEDDLYVILVDWQPISTQQATFKVFRNPLVAWLWLGSLVLILGSIIAVWPNSEKELSK
jgi:cytochrome c-type biogenesis protein CcmF